MKNGTGRQGTASTVSVTTPARVGATNLRKIMSKRARQRRRRRKAKKLKATVKQRAPMPPPCQNFGDARKEENKNACRGKVEYDE